MSSARRDSNIKSKSKPSEGKCQKSNVRVGSEFQISIPEFTETRPDNYFIEPSEREERVWSPERSPPSSDINAYIAEAKKFSYPLDAALTLLHYHKYNIQHAIDDLPNYEPILNNYTKSAVRSFLKSVDGRPRKNFVKVSRDFPGYTMGEIQSLYYAIAAPFKAQSRRGPKYALQMRNCYQKALKLGFTTHHSAYELHKCGTDPDEVVADAQFEGYFHQIMSSDRASKLCKSVIRGRPYISKVNGNGNGAKGTNDTSRGMAANGALASNRRQIFTESLRRVAHKLGKNDRYLLQNFNLIQFIDFTDISESDVEEELAKSNSQLLKMDEDLKKSTEEIETTNEGIFRDLDSLYPRKHFENEVTFRWTKSEFAILVMALDAYGKDFAQIAKIMATKTESTIRDFYNKYNERFGLDAFINKENKEPKVDKKDEGVVSDGLVESAGGVFENEAVQNDEPPLIIATPQKRRTQSNSNSLQKAAVASPSPKNTKFPKEDKDELPPQKPESEETKAEEEAEPPEIRKDEDSVVANETPKSRRGRARKEVPVRRVSTRSLSSESPASAVRRRSLKSAETVETPSRRQRKPSTPTTVESPAPRPRGRPSLKKLAERVQESSPSGRLSKGTKGDQSSRTTKIKVKDSPVTVSKRKPSIHTQNVLKVPKKRARNSSLSPRSSRLRR